ncbi:S-adenosyl-L-methionine-dependent methyltransferase [Hypoxylon sp. FL1284]|nr:S-adenosyl-L-methionine-dependent methyltransferase [Hypoxylon sp. FL1284]
MEALLEQIKGLAEESDDARRKAMTALQSAAFSLESPQDTIHRYGHMNLQAAAVKIGIDLKVFRYLVELNKSVIVNDIAQAVGAELQLMVRLMRYLAAIGAVDETGITLYRANHVTRNLSERLVEAGLSHYFGTAGPPYQFLPLFLHRNGYKNPDTETQTAFKLAFETSLDSFSWFAHHPVHLADFNAYMALRRGTDATWLSVYPVADEAAGWPAEKPLYVNIGGGVGHQCAQFKEKFPSLPGRVVLQDLLHSVAQALPTPGVENMAHDMFLPQPVVGAKFYHLRAVLHNHPPHKIRQLLQNIKAAMTPESVLIIDEMVFPQKGVSFNAASIDMTMMAAFSSMERTEYQWSRVFEEVGLELVRTYTYLPLSYESAMDVRLPRVA